MSVHRDGGGVSASVHAGLPPRPDTPPGSRQPPRLDSPPGSRTPWDQAPPQDQAPPWTRPPLEADCSIRLMSRRYASYWNAFLLIICHDITVLSLGSAILTVRITEAFSLPNLSLFCNVQRDVASLSSYSKLNSKCDS